MFFKLCVVVPLFKGQAGGYMVYLGFCLRIEQSVTQYVHLACDMKNWDSDKN